MRPDCAVTVCQENNFHVFSKATIHMDLIEIITASLLSSSYSLSKEVGVRTAGCSILIYLKGPPVSHFHLPDSRGAPHPLTHLPSAQAVTALPRGLIPLTSSVNQAYGFFDSQNCASLFKGPKRILSSTYPGATIGEQGKKTEKGKFSS